MRTTQKSTMILIRATPEKTALWSERLNAESAPRGFGPRPTEMNMKDASTSPNNSMLELVAYDDHLALYSKPGVFEYLHTFRRDRKKLTQKDRREAAALIDLLLSEEKGNA